MAGIDLNIQSSVAAVLGGDECALRASGVGAAAATL
jgi:hypothetical protein